MTEHFFFRGKNQREIKRKQREEREHPQILEALMWSGQFHVEEVGVIFA